MRFSDIRNLHHRHHHQQQQQQDQPSPFPGAIANDDGHEKLQVITLASLDHCSRMSKKREGVYTTMKSKVCWCRHHVFPTRNLRQCWAVEISQEASRCSNNNNNTWNQRKWYYKKGFGDWLPLLVVSFTLLCLRMDISMAVTAEAAFPHSTHGQLSPVAATTPDQHDVYVIVSHPDNSLSVEVAKLLQPAIIYWIVLCAPGRQQQQQQLQRKLVHLKRHNLLGHFSYWNVYGTWEQLQQSANDCWDKLRNDLSNNECDVRLCGVLFNQYGYSDSNSSNNTASFLSPLALYKLLSTVVWMDTLLALATRQQHLRENHHDRTASSRSGSSSTLRLSPSLRIVAVGTEAARGLPRMGFPVPTVDCTEDCVRNILCGDDTSSWERDYAEVNALLVLYLKALAAVTRSAEATRDWYVGIVSPGMTQESLQVRHVPWQARTLLFRLKLLLCRHLWFGRLVKMEIAKTVEEGGRLLTDALLGREGGPFCIVYPSGSFVGARSGTGGPLCEQSELDSGKFLEDFQLQQLVYDVVRRSMGQHVQS
jgi:hypothetical protein